MCLKNKETGTAADIAKRVMAMALKNAMAGQTNAARGNGQISAAGKHGGHRAGQKLQPVKNILPPTP